MTMLINPFRFGGGGASSPLIFDAPNTSARLALSNGDRTITRDNNSAGGYAFGRGSHSHSSGKHYFEIMLVDNNATNDPLSLGVCLATARVLTTTGAAGSPSSGSGFGESCIIIFSSNGNYYLNGTLQYQVIAATTSGDIISVALDSGLQKAWFKRNADAWCSAMAGTQNPATGQGGITLPVSTGWGAGNPLWPYAGIRRNSGWPGGVSTLCGDTSQFTYSPPSGFLPWGA